MGLIYAIGDIHGCYAKLLMALAKIEAHAGDARFRAVFLGDYVDRGPASRDVVNRVKDLVGGRDAGRGHWQALKGNHEAMMADAILRHSDIGMWERNGGDKTLRAYGGYASELEDHARWFETLPTMIETEHHAFVHAGCSPEYALADQPEEVRLWIRKWEGDDHDFGKHIVFGHDARDSLNLRRFSTGLDTGACYGGPLSVGVFDDTERGGPIAVLTAD